MNSNKVMSKILSVIEVIAAVGPKLEPWLAEVKKFEDVNESNEVAFRRQAGLITLRAMVVMLEVLRDRNPKNLQLPIAIAQLEGIINDVGKTKLTIVEVRPEDLPEEVKERLNQGSGDDEN